MLTMFFQGLPAGEPSQIPVTVEGALIALILVAIYQLPGLSKALIAWVNSRTDEQVKRLDVFKTLTDELAYVRNERDRLEKRVDDQQTQIERMQGQLNTVTSESQAKDQVIGAKTQRIAELETANAVLEQKVTKLEGEKEELTQKVATLQQQLQEAKSQKEE